MKKIATQLQTWFEQNRRSLPWREKKKPYRVWVAEVMLQQTQASVVIPYYHRWLEAFPDIPSLAKAQIDQVLKIWEGLGYYRRARNLHQAANIIMDQFGGIFPKDYEKLISIKGIGEYTAGAILSFAFEQKALAIDGNVLRVIARLFGIKDRIDAVKGIKQVQFKVQALLEVGSYTLSEALIELGALVCQRKPECHLCPLKKHCQAFLEGKENELPVKKPRPQTIKEDHFVGVLKYQNLFYVMQGQKKKLMQGLFEFPYITDKNCQKFFEQLTASKLVFKQKLPKTQQSYTRYQVELYPYLFEVKETKITNHWKTLDQLLSLPFSSGHKRILNYLAYENDFTD